MDTGSFYARYGQPTQLFGPRHTQNSQQIPSSYGVHHSDPPYVNQVSIDQKLDRLTRLLEEQRSETAELRNRFTELKDQLDHHIRDYSSCSSQSTPSTPVAPKRLPPELSATVKKLQEKCEEGLRFAGDQLYGSDHNQKVKDYMLSQLSPKFGDVHSPKKIRRAVHRYFESRRRVYNDSRPARKDIAKKVKHDSRKKEARKKLYNSRKKHLKSEKERKMWSEIDYQFMSEESSCDEDVNKRTLPWRSEALNKLISKLDKRADRKLAITKRNFRKKERLQKSPSKLPPPSSSPSWTVSSTFKSPVVTANSSVSDVAQANSSTRERDPETMTTPGPSVRLPVAKRLIPDELENFTDSSSDSLSSSDSD